MSRDLMQSLSRLGREDVLDRLGLEPRRGAAEKLVPVLATFGAGVLLGAAAGLLLAARERGLAPCAQAAEDDPEAGHS